MAGLFLIILAQVSFSIGGLIIRKYLGAYSPYLISTIMAVLSMVIFIPALFYLKNEAAKIPSIGYFWIFMAAIFWVVVAEILYIKGFQMAPNLSLASMMTLFYPLFSTILGIIILHDRLTAKTIIAAILMISGFIFLII